MVPQSYIRFTARDDMTLCPYLPLPEQPWQVPNTVDFDGFACQNEGHTVLLAEYDSRMVRYFNHWPFLDQLVNEPRQWLAVYTAPGKLRAVQQLPPKGKSLLSALQLSPDGHRVAIIQDYRNGHKELQFYKW